MAKWRGGGEEEGGGRRKGGGCMTGRATACLHPGTALNAIPMLSQGSVLLLSSGQLGTETQQLDVLRQDKGQHRDGKAKQRRKKRIKKVEIVGQGQGERR